MPRSQKFINGNIRHFPRKYIWMFRIISLRSTSCAVGFAEELAGLPDTPVNAYIDNMT
jgi:hypothetical protein